MKRRERRRSVFRTHERRGRERAWLALLVITALQSLLWGCTLVHTPSWGIAGPRARNRAYISGARLRWERFERAYIEQTSCQRLPEGCEKLHDLSRAVMAAWKSAKAAYRIDWPDLLNVEIHRLRAQLVAAAANLCSEAIEGAEGACRRWVREENAAWTGWKRHELDGIRPRDDC